MNKLEQLEALVGGHDRFGLGSVIIMTTRSNHLRSIHEFHEQYDDDTLELFS